MVVAEGLGGCWPDGSGPGRGDFLLSFESRSWSLPFFFGSGPGPPVAAGAPLPNRPLSGSLGAASIAPGCGVALSRSLRDLPSSPPKKSSRPVFGSSLLFELLVFDDWRNEFERDRSEKERDWVMCLDWIVLDSCLLVVRGSISLLLWMWSEKSEKLEAAEVGRNLWNDSQLNIDYKYKSVTNTSGLILVGFHPILNWNTWVDNSTTAIKVVELTLAFSCFFFLSLVDQFSRSTLQLVDPLSLSYNLDSLERVYPHSTTITNHSRKAQWQEKVVQSCWVGLTISFN